MISRKSTMALFASVVLPSLAVFADGGYVTLTANSASGRFGFAAADWSDKNVADPSSRDYLVTGGKIFKPLYVDKEKGGREIIPSRSFTFGEVNGGKGIFYAYYDVEFENNGVIFANGECYPNATEVQIFGTATFISPITAPFIFRGSGNRPRGFTFRDNVECESGFGMLAYSQKTNGFYVAFSGDVSKYCGSLVVTSQYDSVGKPWGADLIFKDKATYFGGSVTIGNGAVLKPQVSTSVDSLSLEKGASISFQLDASLSVRNVLSVDKDVVLKLMSPVSVPAEVTQYAILTMPIESECSLEDFIIEEDISIKPAIVELIASEDGKTKSICVTYYPIVNQSKNNSETITDPASPSAETNGYYWSDGQPVNNTRRYKMERLELANGQKASCVLTTRYAPESALAFEGRSLHLTSWSTLRLRVKDYTVPYLILQGAGGTTEITGLNGCDLTLRSRFSMIGTVDVRPLAGATIRLSGPIESGDGAVLRAIGQNETECRAIVNLDGDNTGFTGRICATNYDNRISFDSKFTSLVVQKAENLGGPRHEFAYDALRLDCASRLEVLDSMVLSEPSRGILLNDRGRIYVPEGKILSVLQKLTINGGAYKEGLGMLALGGDLRFLDAEGNVTDTVPEDAENRRFYVTGGKVKPLSAHALDGLDVVFSNETSMLDVGLVLDMNSEDEELRAKGICNVKSPAPFAFLDNDASKKIPVYLECTDELAANELSFGVMTVKKGCEGVFGRLELLKPRSLNSFKITLEQIEDTMADTVTLKATAKKYGFTISIR